MARPRSPKRLPRYVGIYADQHYMKMEWIHRLIQSLNPRSVVVTTEVPKVTDYIAKRVLMRTDLYLKTFELDPWEKSINSAANAQRLRDYQFLSYLKYYEGFLFICPHDYVSGGYGTFHSKRTEELVRMAHTLKVDYTMIEVEGGKDNDKHTKHTAIRQTNRRTGLFGKSRTDDAEVLQEPSDSVQQQPDTDHEN